ncbi:MAG: hypothetical protein IT455_07505 [Planctomycetes bacterium]|nr:hypothetical protein [Planctomycetota bacterium]
MSAPELVTARKPSPFWLVLGLLIVVGTIGSSVYVRWFSRPSPVLGAHLAEVAKQPEGTTIDFSAEIDGTWDTMHVITPYTSEADIEKRLGFVWSGAKRSRAMNDDRWQLVVFADHERVVGAADIGRELIAPKVAIPRAQAKFVVEQGTLRWIGAK